MEPRPHERGNVESVEVAEEMAACFNGATSSRTWKPVSTGTGISGLTTLQWSHVLTNVETTTARTRSRPYRSASMEPRPHERGNCPVVLLTCSGASGFNGATSSRTWKRGHNSRRLRRNVPASMEPRPHERGNRRRVVGADLCIWASMEPRPHERGNRRAALTPRGCAWTLQWSHVLTNVETRRGGPYMSGATRASMEPRPHERGNTPLPGFCRTSRTSLQWSHVLTNVET